MCSSAINPLAKNVSCKDFDESVLKIPASTVLGQETVYRMVADIEQNINTVANRILRFSLIIHGLD